jgi:uncharacterized membrane protein YccC
MFDRAATRSARSASGQDSTQVGGITAEDHLREFRVRHTLKTALACCLCILIPTVLHFQSIYFCPVFAFLLLTSFYHDTLAAALEALLGVLVAAAGALALTALFGAAPPLYLVFMLAWLFALTLFLDRFALGAMLGGIVAATVLFTAIFVSRATVGDLVVHLYGLLLFAMATAVAVDHLVWPQHRRTAFLDVLATIYESLGAGFARLPEGGADDPSELRALLRLHELARVVQGYRGGGLDQTNPLARLLTESSALLLHLEFQRHEWQRAGQAAADEAPKISDRLVAGIGAQCRRISQAALTQTPAQPVEPWLVESANNLIEDAAVPPPAPDAHRPDQVQGLSSQPVLPMLARTIVRLGEATDAYNQSIALLGDPGLSFGAAQPPPPIGAAALKRSAKTVLILVLLIFGQDWLDLPGQTMVAFYAITFGATANLGQAYTRTVDGLAGILVGLLYAIACIGIVAMMPNFTIFLGLVFLGVFGAAYLGLGPGPIGVGALQAGLVLPYATLVYDGPEWTLASAETRAIALLVVGLLALLVHRLVWPALPLQALRRSIAASLTDAGATLTSLFRQPGTPERAAALERLMPLSAVVSRALSLSNDAKYLFSGMGGDSLRYHSVVQGLMSLHVHLSLLGGVLGRIDPPLLESIRAAVAPMVERLIDACATVGAQFDPGSSGPVLTGPGDGTATAALEPIDATLLAQGSSGDQRRSLYLLARSLDHLAECLEEISATAVAINRKGAR